MKPLTTTEKFRKEKLEEKIEFHLQNMLLSTIGSNTYKLGDKLVKQYCEDYRSLTGEYYISKQVQRLREAGL